MASAVAGVWATGQYLKFHKLAHSDFKLLR